MISIVGAVLAVVGIILQLVGIFIHKKPDSTPPPSKQQDFFNETILPYFASLSVPPPTFISDDFKPQLSQYYQIKRPNVDSAFNTTYKYLELTTNNNGLTTGDTFTSFGDRGQQLWQFIAGTAPSGGEIPYTILALTTCDLGSELYSHMSVEFEECRKVIVLRGGGEESAGPHI